MVKSVLEQYGEGGGSVSELNWSKVEMVKSVLEQYGEGGGSVSELNWSRIQKEEGV